MDEKLALIIQSLRELEEDTQVPKHVKIRIANTIKTLDQTSELSIRVSRALSELEELSDDVNMQAFTRTQLFNIVSMLEAI